MSRFNIFSLFFCLPLAASLYGQPLTNQLDSILASPPDTHQVRALLKLADSLNSKMLDIPASLYERGLDLAHRLEYNEGLVSLYSGRYIYFLNGGEVEKGMQDVRQAIKFARITQRDKVLRNASLHEVLFLMIGGRTKKAAEIASELVEEFQESGDLIGESEAYGLLATLSSSFGDYELAIGYIMNSIDLAEKSKSQRTLKLALLSSSASLNVLGKSEEALGFADKLLAIAREERDEAAERNALNLRVEANTARGNYTDALADYNLLNTKGDAQKISWQMTNEGLLLQRIGRHDEARALLLEAIELIKMTSGDPLELKRTYQGLQTVGLEKAQYDTVVWYGRLMVAQEDSLQSAENIRNVLELEEKYEAKERKAEIEAQQSQLAWRRIQLYAVLFGLALSIVFGVVFFRLSQKLKSRIAENERLVKEKETLIGEIHHRVKNNLQVISSLLLMQRRGLESDDTKGQEALLESESRVSAMGLIHNKLYQGKEVTSVHMPDYLKDLGESLIDAYRLEEQVEIFYDVANLWLDVDSAIPLGLIINELVTNSLKYAFLKDVEGTIEIALHREGDQFKLVVTDDGVGADAAEKRADSTSFGSNLILLLTEKLKGSVRLLEGKGHGVEIMFSQ